MNAAQNTTVINKLKRLFGGGNDVSGLTARVDALEARATSIEVVAMGYDVAIQGFFGFDIGLPNTIDMDLETDRFSNVGDIVLDTVETVLPAGCTLMSNTIKGNRERWQLVYDGSGNIGSYPTPIVFVASGVVVTKNINIIINP